MNGEDALGYHDLTLVNHQRLPVEGPATRPHHRIQSVLYCAGVNVRHDLRSARLLVGSALHAKIYITRIEWLTERRPDLLPIHRFMLAHDRVSSCSQRQQLAQRSQSKQKSSTLTMRRHLPHFSKPSSSPSTLLS